MSGTGDSTGGGCGCLSLIITVIVVWALLFGVTYSGRHHDISCSCERGVGIE